MPCVTGGPAILESRPVTNHQLLLLSGCLKNNTCKRGRAPVPARHFEKPQPGIQTSLLMLKTKRLRPGALPADLLINGHLGQTVSGPNPAAEIPRGCPGRETIFTHSLASSHGSWRSSPSQGSKSLRVRMRACGLPSPPICRQHLLLPACGLLMPDPKACLHSHRSA